MDIDVQHNIECLYKVILLKFKEFYIFFIIISIMTIIYHILFYQIFIYKKNDPLDMRLEPEVEFNFGSGLILFPPF